MAVDNTYKKVYKIITEKVNVLERQVDTLKDENEQLKRDLDIANARLEVYERLATISDSKISLGFGPPIIKEGGDK